MLKAAVSGMAELLKEEHAGHLEQWEYGVTLFDELSVSQRLVLLELVATYLFTDTPEPLDLTAANESVIGAVFEHIRSQVEGEIDSCDENETQWRSLVLAAYVEVAGDEKLDDDEEGFPLPTVTNPDPSAWGDLVEGLADNILWDRDYEMEDLFLDESPEKSQWMKAHLGIDEDYYSSAAPDAANEAAMDTILARIDDLTEAT